VLDLHNNNFSGKVIGSAASYGDDVKSGNIPAELSQLSNLQVMCLWNNILSGKSFDANAL